LASPVCLAWRRSSACSQMATSRLEREDKASGESRGCLAGSEVLTRLAPLFDLSNQLGEALTRPQLGQAAWLACGWQRHVLREKETPLESAEDAWLVSR